MGEKEKGQYEEMIAIKQRTREEQKEEAIGDRESDEEEHDTSDQWARMENNKVYLMDVETYGRTWGCQGCMNLIKKQKGGKVKGTAPHTKECRQRMDGLINKRIGEQMKQKEEKEEEKKRQQGQESTEEKKAKVQTENGKQEEVNIA